MKVCPTGMCPCDPPSGKRVLLINPAWEIKKSNLWNKVASCYPSLGLAYIAAVLEREGHEVRIIDMHADNLTIKELQELIDNYDFVGITATTPLINRAYQIAEMINEKNPHATIVFGGVHPTVLTEEVLSHDCVDVVVRGEGEITMMELVNGVDAFGILGISFRHNGKFIHNPERPLMPSLDELPPPAYHLLPINKYRPAVGSYKRLPAMSIFATRGCIGNCSYCFQIMRGKIRFESAQKIIEEIKLLQKDYGIREISFYDDTFTANRGNVMEFCNLLLKEKIDLTWSCFTRVDCVDEDLFRLMKKSGCHQVMIGVESGVQEILDGMNKHITIKQIEDAVAILKKVGLEIRAAYILGNIGDTKETMQKTLDFAIELDTDYAQFNILTAYPGTKVWETAKKNGWLRVKDYDYSVSDFTLELPTVTQQEILDVYKKAHRKYYLRPKVIARRILKLRSFAQVKQEIMGAIAILTGAD